MLSKVKHLKLLFVLSAFFMLSACNKDDATDPVDDSKAENLKALGVSAEDLLSSDIYTKLRIEIVYVAGQQPLQQSINSLEDFLNTRVNKPGGITITQRAIQSPGNSPYNTEEIRDIEAEFREEYTVDDDIAVYIFFADGQSSNDTNTSVTLGTAYRNTSMVVYEDTLKELNDNGNGPDLFLLEATTLHHEFGHLFGLVGIQNDDIHANHEDENHPKHCMVPECLMFFESSLPTRIPSRSVGGNITPLDDLCIADLQAKGGK